MRAFLCLLLTALTLTLIGLPSWAQNTDPFSALELRWTPLSGSRRLILS